MLLEVQGNSKVSPGCKAAIAELMAAVSSVDPLPVAPNNVTFTVVPLPLLPETPVPASAIAGALVALLTTAMLPVTLPAVVGAKATFNMSD